MTSRRHHADLGRVNLSWLEAGDPGGVPVLLLHGFASSAEVNWKLTGWIDLLARATRPPPSAHQRLSPEQLKARALAPCYGLEEYTRQDSDMLLL